MAKRQIKEKNTKVGKTMGRSRGKPVTDPVLGDTVSAKVFAARKVNNPARYNNI